MRVREKLLSDSHRTPSADRRRSVRLANKVRSQKSEGRIKTEELLRPQTSGAPVILPSYFCLLPSDLIPRGHRINDLSDPRDGERNIDYRQRAIEGLFLGMDFDHTIVRLYIKIPALQLRLHRNL